MAVAGARASTARIVSLVGVALFATGTVIGFALSPSPAPSLLTEPDGPAVVSVVPREFLDSRQMAVNPIEAPGWDATVLADGVVRETACVVGQPLQSGAKILVVDDRPVLALQLDHPLWRDLAEGSKGDDVADLQRALGALGYPVTVDGRFGRATGDAVEKVWKSLGVSDRQRNVPVGQVLWLNAASVTPSECPLQVGQRASADSVVFRVGGGLVGLEVTVPDSSAAGARTATVGDITTPLPEDRVITDRDFLEAFSAAHAGTSAATDSSASLSVQTQLASPIQVVAVPPSALFGISGARACVMAPDAPEAVEIVASELGEVMVTSARLPSEVLVDPGEQAASCG